MIQIAAAVEHDARNALLLQAIGDHLPQRLGALQVAAAHVAAEHFLERRLDARRRRERPARHVVNHLRINVRDRSEHGQPRPLGRAADPLPLSQLNALATILLG